MNETKSGGLWLGLLVGLLTLGLVAAAAGPIPGEARRETAAAATAEAKATPTASVAIATATTPASSAASATPTASPPPSLTPTATAQEPTPTGSPVETATPDPTSVPIPTPTPEANPRTVIGQSVLGREIEAYRFGEGPIKVVLVGNIHGQMEANTFALVQQLVDHFQEHPEQVPPEASLWLIPSMNPDGLARGNRWNANDVDLNRNADTDLDGCAGNDWSPDTVGLEGPHPGAGGTHPFSEPESQAVLTFLEDAWIAIFYHSAAEAIFLDTCQRHLPTARLAEALAEGTGYPVPEEGWAGYPITGDWGDYLAGEGVAAVTVELTDHEDPEFERNLAGVHAVLNSVSDIVGAEADELGAEYRWLDGNNTGIWQYDTNLFIHPLALEVVGQTAYVLDAGRVLVLDLQDAGEPRVILAPGDEVDGTRVLEPLDLAVRGTMLLVLDRAGDVYGYEPASGTWTLERYDRPPGATYDHYFVALDADGDTGYLLETTHEQVWAFPPGEKGGAWVKLAQGRDVDVSASGGDVYVLTRGLNNPAGQLGRYQAGQRIAAFRPGLDMMHPRQVRATESAVYVLDRAGRRILALDPWDGTLQGVSQFPDRSSVSAMWASPWGEQVILAGRDKLYFVGQPDKAAVIEGGPVLEGLYPHDPELLGELRVLQVPIEGAGLTTRDFQMPGAPRHYRLGVHEGIDFYGHTVGVTVNRRTVVRALADGVVVRALVDYEPLTAAQAEAWYATSLAAGYTPADVLDGYRGRQVWIDYGNGVLSRYAHLSSIAPGIVEGAAVSQGQVVGMVGNSGTPGSVDSDTYDAHLHMELWIGGSPDGETGDGHYAGQFLRPIEAREWLTRILR